MEMSIKHKTGIASNSAGWVVTADNLIGLISLRVRVYGVQCVHVDEKVIAG